MDKLIEKELTGIEQQQQNIGDVDDDDDETMSNSQTKSSSTEMPQYKGTYGSMVLVPRSLYKWSINAAKKILPSLQDNQIVKNVKLAREHANDPKAYSHFMIQAHKFRKVQLLNPNIDQRIISSIDDPHLNKIKSQIKSMRRNKKLLTTSVGMKKYQNLLRSHQRVSDILAKDEHDRYKNFATNPQNALQQHPRSLPKNDYHTEQLRYFLGEHLDILNFNRQGHLLVAGKAVAEDDRATSRLLHYFLRDHESAQPPAGTSEFVAALRRHGYNIPRDIGNKFLREQVIRHDHQPSDAASAASNNRNPLQTSTPSTVYPTTPLQHWKHASGAAAAAASRPPPPSPPLTKILQSPKFLKAKQAHQNWLRETLQKSSEKLKKHAVKTRRRSHSAGGTSNKHPHLKGKQRRFLSPSIDAYSDNDVDDYFDHDNDLDDADEQLLRTQRRHRGRRQHAAVGKRRTPMKERLRSRKRN